MTSDKSFWHELAELAATNLIVIDRPKGSPHPRYPEVIYPLDYGYLEGTTSADGRGTDVWLGSLNTIDKTLTGILCRFDRLKRDAEIKLLIGCTEEDLQIIQDFHKEMHTLYIPNQWWRQHELSRGISRSAQRRIKSSALSCDPHARWLTPGDACLVRVRR